MNLRWHFILSKPNLIYKAYNFHKPPDTSITTVFFDSQVCRVCCTILQRQKILDKKELDSILELLCTLHKMHVFIWCFWVQFFVQSKYVSESLIWDPYSYLNGFNVQRYFVWGSRARGLLEIGKVWLIWEKNHKKMSF